MMLTVPAKMILSSYSDKGWFASNYTMNLYRGCSHACIYCDSRSDCYKIPDFDVVRVKENALNILESELKSKRKKGIILTGAMSDPYNSSEKELQITRNALTLINKYNFGVNILTKSSLVTRDIDILNTIQQHSPVCVNFTITTANDDLCKVIEPNVCSSSIRFYALKTIADNNINCGVVMMPILPFINDNEKNFAYITDTAATNKAKWIFTYPSFAVTLRGNQKEYFYTKLDAYFPGLKLQYMKKYGSSYWCISENSDSLWQLFKQMCEKNNLLYRHNEIDKFIKNNCYKKQTNLF